jgi:rhodanese-related sulfurtransferase
MKNLTKEEWKVAIANDSNAVVLDVRKPEECAQGIQPNAEQLNFLDNPTFMEGIKNLDKSKNYYVYCRSGKRSAGACVAIDEMGITTFNLLGGMMQWDGEIVK